ncbi:Transposon Ty3-I Gag-Pol polyprotein-like protein, partial [Drosera capensis]
VTITLGPSDLRKDVKGNLLSRAELQRELLSGSEIFALVIVEQSDHGLGVPAAIIPLPDEFFIVVSKDLPSGLPPMRDIQHYIDLVSESEGIQRVQIRQFIIISLSSDEERIVPKKDGSWRMCIDSRAVNKITINYRFLIPRFDDLIDQLHDAAIFSKIDLQSRYHQIRIRHGDEWKTAFKMRDGLYGWMVMPFGLSNAPSTIMRLMNQVFRSFVGDFVVRLMNQVFRSFVGDFVVFTVPQLSSICRIKDCFRSVARAEALCQCQVGGFVWNNEAEAAFQLLKQRVTEAPVSILPDFNEVFEVHCDASGVGIGGVMSQKGKPISFFSKKLNGAKRNYSKEFYAIVRSLRVLAALPHIK